MDSSEQPGGAEAAAILCVDDTTAVQEAVPIVQAELISLRLSPDHGSTDRGPENHAAVVMPQYCGSLAAQLQMSEAAIEAGGRRMLRALEYIHSKILVHMDVKVQTALPHHVEMRMMQTAASINHVAWPKLVFFFFYLFCGRQICECSIL